MTPPVTLGPSLDNLKLHNYLIYLVGARGFEPPTSCLPKHIWCRYWKTQQDTATHRMPRLPCSYSDCETRDSTARHTGNRDRTGRFFPLPHRKTPAVKAAGGYHETGSHGLAIHIRHTSGRDPPSPAALRFPKKGNRRKKKPRRCAQPKTCSIVATGASLVRTYARKLRRGIDKDGLNVREHGHPGW